LPYIFKHIFLKTDPLMRTTDQRMNSCNVYCVAAYTEAFFLFARRVARYQNPTGYDTVVRQLQY